MRMLAVWMCLMLPLQAGAAMADEGLVVKPSAHSVGQTVLRLKSALQDKGMTIFAEIDHAAGAAKAGMALRPTTVVIFGNPRGGTPLMLSKQQIGLDLPLKILVWEDESGKVWTTYSDPAWLARRYGIEPSLPPIAVMSSTLAELAVAAGHD